MQHELWTVEEVARKWRVKPSWIYQYMAELPHLKLGILVRFDPEELRKYLSSVRRGPKPVDKIPSRGSRAQGVTPSSK